MDDLRTYLSETARRELDSLRAALDTRLMALEKALAHPDPTESLESLIIDLARVATDEAHASAAHKWLEAQASAAPPAAADAGAGIHGALIEESAGLRRDVEELRGQLQRESERGDSLRRDTEAAQGALQEERGSRAKLDAELTRLKRANTDLLEAVETLRGDLDAARKRLADAMTEGQTAAARGAESGRALAALQAQLAETERGLEAERSARRDDRGTAEVRIAEAVGRAESAESALATERDKARNADAALTGERERAAAMEQSFRAEITAEAEKVRAAQADLTSAIEKLQKAEASRAAEAERARAAEERLAAEVERTKAAEAAASTLAQRLQAAEASLSAEAEKVRAAEARLSAEAEKGRAAEAALSAEAERMRAAEAGRSAEADKAQTVQAELVAVQNKLRAAESELASARSVFDAAREEAAAALATATARVRELEVQVFRREQASAETHDLDLGSMLEDRSPSADRPIRRFSRYSFRSKMAVDIEGESAQLVDLSVGGAQVLSETPLELQREAAILLVSDEIPVSGRATVMWTRADPQSKWRALRYRAGIQFTDVDPAAVEAFIIRYSST